MKEYKVSDFDSNPDTKEETPYGYIVYDEDGDVVDSYHGCFSSLEDAAKDAAEYLKGEDESWYAEITCPEVVGKVSH